MAEFQWFSGLGVKATKAAVAPLALVPAEQGSDRLLLPDDADAWRRFEPSDVDRFTALVGADRPGGGLVDLPSHAILERGRLVGLWEYSPEDGAIVWGTFDRRRDPVLAAAIEETTAFVRDQLGDARSFSLDSPKSRSPRSGALRGLGG